MSTSSMTSPVAVPRPLDPLDGAYVDASAVPFSWRGVPGASGYQVQVSTTPDFTGDVLDVDAGATTALTLYGALPARDAELYWRVRADEGEAWSGYGRFVAGHDDAVEAYRNERDTERAEAAVEAARRREAAEADRDLIPLYEQPGSVTSTGEASTLVFMLITFALTLWLIYAVA